VAFALMGAAICWAAAQADTHFANFDLAALEKQRLISNPTIIKKKEALC